MCDGHRKKTDGQIWMGVMTTEGKRDGQIWMDVMTTERKRDGQI